MPEKIDVTFRTWQKSEPATLKRFYDLIQERPLLHPEKLGPYEPMEYSFGDLTAQVFSRLLTDEESLVTQRNRFPEQGIYFMNLSGAKSPNVFNHSIEGVEEGSGEAREFLGSV